MKSFIQRIFNNILGNRNEKEKKSEDNHDYFIRKGGVNDGPPSYPRPKLPVKKLEV